MGTNPFGTFTPADKKILYCSFCGKSQHEVQKLIAGPTVFICNECIDLCNDIVHEEGIPPSTLAGIARLVMQEWIYTPGGLDTLKQEIAEGNILAVVMRAQQVLIANATEFEQIGKERNREKMISVITACLISTVQCYSALGINEREISKEILKWATKKHGENARAENKPAE